MFSNKVKTLRLQFKNEIALWEIPLFRGCVIHSMDNANLLFHNHDGDEKLRYSYPLIQYKRIGGKAAIVCVGEGTEAIGEFFQSGNFSFQIGERCVNVDIEHIEAKQNIVQVWNDEFYYTLRKWLPLSTDNYNVYKNLDGIAEKVLFLQQILIGNMLSFCKGMGICVDKEITCSITNMLDERFYKHKGVKKIGLDIEFKTNVSLPNFIGLGKGVSMGYGTLNIKTK